MNNVTTSLALSIGEAIKDEVSFEELPQKALTVHPNEWKSYYLKIKRNVSF